MSQTLDNLSYTWNNAGTTFTGIKYNVTDTASNAASLLMDLQVGGSSKFKVDKTGIVSATTFSTGLNSGMGAGPNPGFYANNSLPQVVVSNYAGLILGGSSVPLSWTSTNNDASSGTRDLFLYRDGAADTLAQRRSTNAQTFRLYSTYTDSSNYTRLKIGFASGNCEIKPENAGTGGAALLHISGLPTSNPGPGILWNDAGAVKVGT